MKYKFEFWNAHLKKIMGEKSAVRRWDLWNGTKKLKKFEKSNISSKEIAKENHKNHLDYEFIVLDDDNELFCTVTMKPSSKHIGVHFIDPGERNYLSYHFAEVKSKEQLFLEEIWYLHFTKEFSDEEEYRIHHVFDEEGNVAARKYDDKKQQYTDYEGKTPIDTRILYEPYPEFGEYKGIITLDRAIPMIDQEERKYYYMDGTRYYKDNAGNLIEDPT